MQDLLSSCIRLLNKFCHSIRKIRFFALMYILLFGMPFIIFNPLIPVIFKFMDSLPEVLVKKKFASTAVIILSFDENRFALTNFVKCENSQQLKVAS